MTMEMVEYSLNDYENFIDIKNGVDFYGATICESYQIDESKGIVDDYLNIIDELYDAICDIEPIPFNDDNFYLAYNLPNYKMKQDCFIDSLALNALTRSNKKSYFLGDNAEITSNEYKIRSIKISISISQSDIKSNIGKEEFYSEMSHELQHAYRFYCILLSRNQSYSDEEHIKMQRSKTANNMISNYNDESPQNIIGKLYYLSDKNEISSETNRLYEYIRANKDVNYENYHTIRYDLPLYILMINLKGGIDKIENERGNEEFSNEYGNIYKMIIGDATLTPSRALMKLRTRLIYGYMFALRNFKRTLIKAFKDFNRIESNFNENKVLNTLINW